MRIRKGVAPGNNAVGNCFLKNLIIKDSVTAGVSIGCAVNAHAERRTRIVKENSCKFCRIIVVNLLTDMVSGILVCVNIFADMRKERNASRLFNAL